MNDQTDGADKALQIVGRTEVQTSAQATAETAHTEPALGGSYIRNPETGALVKSESAHESNEQE